MVAASIITSNASGIIRRAEEKIQVGMVPTHVQLPRDAVAMAAISLAGGVKDEQWHRFSPEF
jgi:hypothetical protein